jgi:hypothetical protein
VLGGNKIRLTQTYSITVVPRQTFFDTPRPCNIPVASLTSSGVPRWTKQGIFCFTVTGARPPVGTRGGVARLASFDKGVLMPNPQKIGEKKRRDVAEHPATLQASATPFCENHKRRQRHDEGSKRIIRKTKTLCSPTAVRDCDISAHRKSATKVELTHIHPTDARLAKKVQVSGCQ